MHINIILQQPGMGGHVVAASAFVLLFLLLSRPEVIIIAELGSIVWYPATDLMVAFMLTISPWYGVLAAVSVALAGILTYHQPVITWSGTVGAILIAGSFAGAAYLLRGPLQIDLGLRQQRDVILYVSFGSRRRRK